MPKTSGWPAASSANPIGSLMFSENIWQHFSSLIHLTWQNLAIWPLPCSVSILKTHFEKCQQSWVECINIKVDTQKNYPGKICGAGREPVYTTASGDTGSWLICCFLTYHWKFILGVIGTRSLLISAALMQGRKAAGSTGCTLHPSLPFKAEKCHSLDCRWPGWLPLWT